MAATLKLQKPPSRKAVSPPPPKAPPLVDDPIASATAADDVLSVHATAGAESPIGPKAEQAPGSRHQTIAQAAYFLAQARGFEQGHELDDWLAAERQIDVP